MAFDNELLCTRDLYRSIASPWTCPKQAKEVRGEAKTNEEDDDDDDDDDVGGDDD